MTLQCADVVVVGAGLAGLACARHLHAEGLHVVVLDKARGTGGRMATRRNGALAFDHGAQYFTVRDAGFSTLVHELGTIGVVRRWEGVIASWSGDQFEPTAPETRFVGVPGMSSVCKHLATSLDVHFEQRVMSLTEGDDGWTVTAESGHTWQAARVVLALPPAQAATLLTARPGLQGVCESVDMAPCWAAMLSVSAPLSAGFDGCFVNDGPLRWIARNSSKPGRAAGDTWVAHASAAWSRQHVAVPAPEVARRLQEAFDVIVPGACAGDVSVHRWLYSQAEHPLSIGHAFEDGIGIAGDWLAGSRVEGAWCSGDGLARRLLAVGD